jgi:tetratricopeptide (TPR) repeat protein
MFRMRIIVCLMLLLPQLMRAGEAETLFEQANTAYADGDYARAMELYQAVGNMGYESAALYFNLGNAAYKENQLGRAILNYERAARLEPSNEDVLFNLKLANMRLADKVETTPQFLVARWWNEFLNGRASGSWAGWATALLWLALMAGAAFLFVNASMLKRITFVSGIVLLVASLFCLGLGIRKRNLEENSRYAIIMAANAYVKSAPDGQSTDLFILHEGLKVEIIDATEGWMRILLADGKSGWIETAKIGQI